MWNPEKEKDEGKPVQAVADPAEWFRPLKTWDQLTFLVCLKGLPNIDRRCIALPYLTRGKYTHLRIESLTPLSF